MKIFVTGVNGFIGTHFLENVLLKRDWEITGFDISDYNLAPFFNNTKFRFIKGDIFRDNDVIEEEIKKCDVVLTLAGVAKPAYYIEKPLWTYELDFEQNLKVVRWCSEYGKRVIFPSTSEVYGMSNDDVLREDESPLITGPIKKMRWIYSCSKQMMDRLIFAYGQERNLKFTLFRPFNWIGPRLDTFKDAEERKARSITQFIYDTIKRREVTLVDGGAQRRSFTWVGDAIEGLAEIIADKNNNANGEIFNIGNPSNNYSIKEMAEIIIDEAKKFPCFAEAANATTLKIMDSRTYYGKTYDDMQNRVPSVEKMKNFFGWESKTTLRDAIRYTLDWHSKNNG
ncbi:MAG: bifunctional UDP-4-keto-pentose/UDP-xylose synthase [Synergistaceae bacterium]|nr:bifunctional UDP-4-keto-pentose/UDP-xylose synthase [Synergistaceae bacterium]